MLQQWTDTYEQSLLKPPDSVTVQVGGLYKGMSSPMAAVAMVNAVVFGVYGNFQRHSPQPDALSSHFLAGAAAGFVQSFMCSPMELVKTRLQVQQHSAAPGGGYGGPMNCLSQVTSLLLLLCLNYTRFLGFSSVLVHFPYF